MFIYIYIYICIIYIYIYMYTHVVCICTPAYPCGAAWEEVTGGHVLQEVESDARRRLAGGGSYKAAADSYFFRERTPHRLSPYAQSPY